MLTRGRGVSSTIERRFVSDEISRVWNLFPTANYRTSVAYVASPVWIDPALPWSVAGPVVEDRMLTAPGGAEGHA